MNKNLEKLGRLLAKQQAIILACYQVDPLYEFRRGEKNWTPHKRSAGWGCDFYYTQSSFPAYVSSEAKCLEACELLTKWGVK